MSSKKIFLTLCMVLVVFSYACANEQECETDAECKPNKAFCLEGTCHPYKPEILEGCNRQSPPCAENAICSFGHNNGTQFLICTCKPGYSGDAFDNCTKNGNEEQ